jgi:hypothetical protein
MLGFDHGDESLSNVAGDEAGQDLAEGVVGDAAVDAEEGVVLLRDLSGAQFGAAERGGTGDHAGDEATEDGGQRMLDVGEIARLGEALEVKIADAPFDTLGSCRLTIHLNYPIKYPLVVEVGRRGGETRRLTTTAS